MGKLFVELGKSVCTKAGIKADGACVDNCGISEGAAKALLDRGVLTDKDPKAAEKRRAEAAARKAKEATEGDQPEETETGKDGGKDKGNGGFQLGGKRN